MVSISQKGIENADETTLVQLRQEFSEKRCIVLPRFIEEGILQKIMKSVDNASFFENEHIRREDKIVFATDLSVPGNEASRLH